MNNTQAFDKDEREYCERTYRYQSVEQLQKHRKKLLQSVKHEMKSMEQAGNARANIDPYASRARITNANARYHATAEEYERQSGRLRYVNELLEEIAKSPVAVPHVETSHDALFDGSDAHLLNDAGDGFEDLK